MKKIISLILLLICTSYADEPFTFIHDKTGFYGCYVQSMPFWKFWNRSKVYTILSEQTHTDPDVIEACIDAHLPILMTWDYEQAQKLQKLVAEYGCELEIKEMQFALKNG